ncbi:MAG: 30S ribosomal protein S9 [Candidatus Saccharibacteria bacterium]|jgi:small subunit ribosomal protein S9
MATKANTYFYGLGRRKRSTAQVKLQSGKGNIVINGQTSDEYFDLSKHLTTLLTQPFTALDLEANKFDITTKVSGGGHTGQVEAIRLGISKALAIMNEDYKATLRRADLLGRDSRERERKKFGLRGARKQRQFTKR